MAGFSRNVSTCLLSFVQSNSFALIVVSALQLKQGGLRLGEFESFPPQEANVESRFFMRLLSMLVLLALAGCQSLQSLNPLSRSHGLPAQYEAEADGGAS
jgi:hypothetical protein